MSHPASGNSANKILRSKRISVPHHKILAIQHDQLFNLDPVVQLVDIKQDINRLSQDLKIFSIHLKCSSFQLDSPTTSRRKGQHQRLQ